MANKRWSVVLSAETENESKIGIESGKSLSQRLIRKMAKTTGDCFGSEPEMAKLQCPSEFLPTRVRILRIILTSSGKTRMARPQACFGFEG